MVFFSHRRGTKATYLLLGLFFFPPLALRGGGAHKLPLIIPPTGPNPSTGSIQLPRRLFLPTSTTNNKKYTFCRAGLINGLLACCGKPCLNYVNGHPTGTMIQNPMARYLTLMYRLQCIKIVVRSADEGRQARWAGSADVVNHQTDGKYVYCEVQYLKCTGGQTSRALQQLFRKWFCWCRVRHTHTLCRGRSGSQQD